MDMIGTWFLILFGAFLLFTFYLNFRHSRKQKNSRYGNQFDFSRIPKKNIATLKNKDK